MTQFGFTHEILQLLIMTIWVLTIKKMGITLWNHGKYWEHNINIWICTGNVGVTIKIWVVTIQRLEVPYQI